MNTSLVFCFSILLVSCVVFSHADFIREKRGLGGLGQVKQVAGMAMKRLQRLPVVGGLASGLTGLLGGRARIDTYDQYSYDDGNEMRERMDTDQNKEWQQYSDYDYNDN